MGEAKRRRAQYAELKMVPAGDLAAMGSMCSWNGCHAAYEATPDGQPPPGWRILYLMKRYTGGKLPNGEPVLRIFSADAGIERDCVLCPKHAEELKEKLFPLQDELIREPQGTA